MSTLRVELPCDPASTARARQLVRECAEQLGRPDLGENAELLVSELVANAIRHAGPPLVVRCEESAGGLQITVCDGSSGQPVLRSAAGTDEAGRGLMLVDVLAAEWGIDLRPEGGKAVWAVISD